MKHRIRAFLVAAATVMPLVATAPPVSASQAPVPTTGGVTVIGAPNSDVSAAPVSSLLTMKGIPVVTPAPGSGPTVRPTPAALVQPGISPAPRGPVTPAQAGAQLGFCPNRAFGTTCYVTFYAEPNGASWQLVFFFFTTAYTLESLPPLYGTCHATFCSYSEAGGGGGALPYAWRLEPTNNIAVTGISRVYK